MAAGGGVRRAISSSSSSLVRELHETYRSRSRPDAVPAGVEDGITSTLFEVDVAQPAAVVDGALAATAGGDGGTSAGPKDDVAAPAKVEAKRS